MIEKPRILVIDDENGIRTAMKYLFEGAGYACITASNGYEGIRKSRNLLPDVILLDIVLPDINGCKVCEAIKSYPATSKIPVVILTIKKSRSDILEALGKGADDYLIKPSENDLILVKVENLLKKKKGKPPNPQIIEKGGIRIDLATRTVFAGKKEIPHLTRKEFDLLVGKIAVQNIGPQMRFIKEGYNLPMAVSAGLGYNLGAMLIALDIKQQVYEGRTSISVGTEYWPVSSIALRAGYATKLIDALKTNGITSSETGNFSIPTGFGAGLGLKFFSNYQMDYSFVPYGILGDTHRMSLSAKF